MTLPTLDHLETRRHGLTARLDALPDGVVHARPAPGQWSLAQIAEHFLKIERTLRLRGEPASAWTYATSGPRNALMRGMLALPVRYPMPPGAVSRIAPSPDARWGAVRAEWGALRAAWREALPSLPPRTVVFKHPIIGLLPVADALRFVLSHHCHHDRQIERTLAAVSASARR
jgi:hypothetical protein